jgi:GYF domain 2
VNADWFYSEGDERRGPVTEEELKRLATDGKLQKTDLVWKDGMKDWVEARTVDTLFPRRAEQSREGDYDGRPSRRRFDPEAERPSRARRTAELDEHDDRPNTRRRRRELEDEDDRPRVRRAYDDDRNDDYDRPRRKAPVKPGQIQAIAIMMMVGGILGLLSMLLAIPLSGFLCCAWPGTYFEVVVGVLLIVRAVNMFGRDDQGPPRTLAILQIICIANGDIVNCVMGIVSIVMLNAPEVVSYYRKKGFEP